MSTPSIRRVSYLDILGAREANHLIEEYAAECSIPGANPQVQMYSAMEHNKSLQCFGAYLDGELIGFESVLNGITPHHGKRVATVESLFVSPEFRDTGAGNALLASGEAHASKLDCAVVLYTARKGSALEKVLSRRSGCEASHTVFSRWL